jgi:hypothetical protein
MRSKQSRFHMVPWCKRVRRSGPGNDERCSGNLHVVIEDHVRAVLCLYLIPARTSRAATEWENMFACRYGGTRNQAGFPT